MKKITVIAAIILTTGLTAFSLAKKENKTEVKIETSSAKNVDPNVASLATAD